MPGYRRKTLVRSARRTQTLGNWTDEPCHYIAARDRDTGAEALLLGPFRAADYALQQAASVEQHARERFAHLPPEYFERMSFAVVLRENGWRGGLFNSDFSPSLWTGYAIKQVVN